LFFFRIVVGVERILIVLYKNLLNLAHADYVNRQDL